MSPPPRGEGGASLVEFAIIAPLLLILLFGIIDTSRAIFAYTTVWSAAREGARAATTNESYFDCSAIADAVRARVVTVPASDLTINIEYTDPVGSIVADCDHGDPTYPDPSAAVVISGSFVTVAVEADFDAIAPLVDIFLDGLALDSTQTRAIFVAEEVGGP